MLTTTGLKSSTVDNKMQERMQATLAAGPNVNVRTVGGKDIRTNKVMREDLALSKFEVTMNKQFDDAMRLQQEETALIGRLQAQQRDDNR